MEEIKEEYPFLTSENTPQTEAQLAGILGEGRGDEDSQDESCYEGLEQDKQRVSLPGIFLISHKEEELIANCDNVAIKQLMIANRAKKKKLQQLSDNLFKLLSVCQSNELQNVQKEPAARLGIPYFKDTNFDPSPPNIDVEKKEKNGELFINRLSQLKKWYPKDEVLLKNSVTCRYFEYNRKLLEQKILLLKEKCKTAKDINDKISLEEDIKASSDQLEGLVGLETHSPPPLGCEIGIDWEKIASEDFNGRRSANECEAFWNIYVHPDINKEEWTLEEDFRLEELLQKYNNQNWDKIAEELNTKRTGFTTFLHCNTSLNKKSMNICFGPQNDAYLLEVVEKCRLETHIPWEKVSQFFRRKYTQSQLRHNYENMLKNCKKTQFTESEDILLKLLIKKYGKSFSECTKYVKDRNVLQLQNRYVNYINKSSNNNTKFTPQEDMKIMAFAKETGKNWGALAHKLNRPRYAVKFRYKFLKNWCKNNPGKDISEYFNKYKNQIITEKAYEKAFNLDYIPALPKIEWMVKREELRLYAPSKYWQGKNDVKSEELDEKLLNFFQNSRDIKPSNHTDIHKCALAVKTVLELLGASFLNRLHKENILKSQNLDDMDKKILTQVLEEEEPQPSTSKLNEERPLVLCPNIHSLIILKNLLKMLQSPSESDQLNSTLFDFLDEQFSSNNFLKTKTNLKAELKRTDPKLKPILFEERRTFMRRFHSLFRWSVIMSLSEPKYTVQPLFGRNGVEQQHQNICEKRLGKQRMFLSTMQQSNNNCNNRKVEEETNEHAKLFTRRLGKQGMCHSTVKQSNNNNCNNRKVKEETNEIVEHERFHLSSEKRHYGVSETCIWQPEVKRIKIEPVDNDQNDPLAFENEVFIKTEIQDDTFVDEVRKNSWSSNES